MSQGDLHYAMAPALSPEYSHLGYSDDPPQHLGKRHKKDGHAVIDFNLSSKGDPMKSFAKERTTSPSNQGSQKLQARTRQMIKTDPIRNNASYQGTNKTPGAYDMSAQYLYPTASTAHHDAHQSQTHLADYSRSPETQMPYSLQCRQHTQSSYRNPPPSNAYEAEDSSSGRFQSQYNENQLPRNSNKRPSSELSTSYQHQTRHEEALDGNGGLYAKQKAHYEGTANAVRRHYESNTSGAHGRNAPVTPAKPSADTSQADPAKAGWLEVPPSYPRYYSGSAHRSPPPSHLTSSHRQSSNWYGDSKPYNLAPEAPSMTRHDLGHYSRSGHHMYLLNKQAAAPPHHINQGMMVPQGPMLCQQTSQANYYRPPRPSMKLAMAEDESWLSDFLCFVRKHCTEVICASQEDVASRMNSKKVVLGQVGIRCLFCARLEHKRRGPRSSTFPSSLSRIYQSLTMMIRDHFESCPAMPPELKERYKDLRANTSQGIDGSKQYWVDSAKKRGLVDTDSGISLKDRSHFSAGPS